MPTLTNATVSVPPLAPTIQYLYGETNPVMVTVASAQVVTKGDIVGMDASLSGAGGATTINRAEDETWASTLAATQDNFAKYFLGIAAQSKRSTDTVPYGNSNQGLVAAIEVNTTGVYEGPCASATFEIGDLLGPAKASGNALLSQKLVKVTSEAEAIGRVVERGTSITSVKFQIISTLVPQGRRTLPAQS
jgi:hypothetical protein